MYQSSEAAEIAFYEAFEGANLEAMMNVWAKQADVVCIHPMGPRIEGWDAVRASWAQILAGGGDGLRFEVTNRVRSVSDGLAVHFVYENITFGSGPTQRSVVLATNVFRETDQGWRMICHHGSPGRVGTMQITEPGRQVH